jgi:hypothetical protein
MGWLQIYQSFPRVGAGIKTAPIPIFTFPVAKQSAIAAIEVIS